MVVVCLIPYLSICFLGFDIPTYSFIFNSTSCHMISTTSAAKFSLQDVDAMVFCHGCDRMGTRLTAIIVIILIIYSLSQVYNYIYIYIYIAI